ncbi:LOW QUALITY PROTEIN: zinc finger Ran-binding domain-containing protein 2 [Tautogolabrus adspersus]
MSGKSFRVSDGDWICPDKKCGNVNFARRTSCNRCGREKTTEAKMMKAGGTEIGKTLAEKSRGLFSANDWQCKTCGNVNWARRSECNMCNTPKYAKLEERTGYGGGFNERENVEYIEREESDGEYDEFGRKKKKFRGKTSSTSSSKETEKKEVVKAVDDEEEEEEDDEDGDLSKYKLDVRLPTGARNLRDNFITQANKNVINKMLPLQDDDEDDEEEEDGDLSKYDLVASEDEDMPAKKKGSRSGSSRSRSSSRSSSSSSRSRSRSGSRSSSSSRSGSRSRSHSRSSSRSGKGSSPKKRSRSPSSSPERGQKRSRSRSSSGERKRRRSRSRSSERCRGQSSGSSHSGSSSKKK